MPADATPPPAADAAPPPQPRFLQKTASALLLVASASLLAGLWRALGDVVDDAHITFRYAENVAAGHGWTFNPGTAAVEGFSNPLLAFVLAATTSVRIAPDGMTTFLGLAAFLGAVAAAGGIAGALGAPDWARRFAMAGVLGHFPLLYYSVTGMETGIMAGLLAMATWRMVALGGRVDRFGAVLWLGVALCRPEGLMFPGLLGVVALVGAWRARTDRTRWRTVGWLLAVGAAYGVFLVWRWITFGALLPNTWLAKPAGTASLDTNVTAFHSTLRMFTDFLVTAGILLPALAIGFLVRNPTKAWIPAIVVGGGVVFGLYTGGDWMPEARYLLPILPVVVAVGAAGFARVVDRRLLVPGTPRLLAAFVAVLGAGLLTLGSPAIKLAEFTQLRDTYPYTVLDSEPMTDAGRMLRLEYGTDMKLVTQRIGAIGRESRMEIIDLFGLVDRDIARIVSRTPGYHPTNAWGDDVPELRALIAARDPDLFLMTTARQHVEPSLVIWDLRFDFVRSFPLGRNEWGHLYERAR